MGRWISPAALPVEDSLAGHKQHDDVQRQTIADQPCGKDFEPHNDRDTDPDRQAQRQPEAHEHRRNVGRRVDHCIAPIFAADGEFAVTVDHSFGVFANFPGAFNKGCNQQPPAQTNAAQNQPGRAIKQEAVDQVAGRIPVKQMLRALAAVISGIPDADVTTGADHIAPHHPQDDQRGGKNEKRGPIGQITTIKHAGMETYSPAHV